MERKLRNATFKLRNLKDFLSSTRSLSQHAQGPSTSHHHHHHHKSIRKSSGSGDAGRQSLSVSLFDLVDPPLCSSRPPSMALSGHSYGNGAPPHPHHHQASVSMYGLAAAVSAGTLGEEDFGTQRNSSLAENRPAAVLTSKNPALRLFYTIRSKFRRRKRDRLNKIVDSKSTNDFGPFLSGMKHPLEGNAVSGNQSSGPSTRYQLETSNVPYSQSVNHLDYIGEDFDSSFASPLGYRDRNYEMEKENSTPHLLTSNSGFVIEDNTNDSSQATSTSTAVGNPGQPVINLAVQFGDSSQEASMTDPIPLDTPTGAATGPSTITPPKSSEPKLKGLAKELFDLIHFGWYWGGLSKEDAEEKLKDEPDGAFIVRDSSSSLHLLTLSFNSNGKTKHTRIEYVDGKFSFMSSETESFPSVAELIEHWIQNTEKGILCYSKSARANAPTSYPVRLTKPISRFTEVKSLRFLSSFVIYQYTRLDLIPKLPLPPPLINFIGQQRFLGN